MPALTSLLLGGGALLGGVAGAMGSSSTQTTQSGINVGSASGLENQGSQILGQSMGELQGLVGRGPGGQDVDASLGASRDLASLLGNMSKEGGNLPTSGDISSSQNLASQLFKPQQTALEQAFADQSVQANRQSALMGRAGDDPILRAKLAQEQTRQQSMLGAQQGAWSTGFALQQPMQRLQFASGRADVLGGLATQALQNRQMLAAMGEGVQTNERNWRLQTGNRWSNSEQESGGGVGGAISGAIGGLGAGFGLAKGLGSLGGGGGGGLSMPQFGSSLGAQPGAFGTNYNQSPSNFFAQGNPFGGAPSAAAAPYAGANGGGWPAGVRQSPMFSDMAGNYIGGGR